MTKKIVIGLEELVSCPQCTHRFPLRDGITLQTIERYEAELEEALAERRRAIEAQANLDAERQAGAKFGSQIEQLTRAADEARQQLAVVRAEAVARAKEEFLAEKKVLSDELAEKAAKVKELQEQEVALRAEKRKVEEERQAIQLSVQRLVDEERQKIQVAVSAVEAEKSRLREAELRKQIEDAKKVNEDLSRKLEQRSQQLQGEVLELEVEHILADVFRHDRIEPIKAGARGADVLQVVRTPAGDTCGKILWEAKRAENWSDKWVEKLRDDQQEAGAAVAVLVSTVMPKGSKDGFARFGDLWVIPPHLMVLVANVLRAAIIDTHRLKAAHTGRAEKMAQAYDYLTSPRFTQRVQSVIETFEAMRAELESEKRTTQQRWAKRQTQLDRVTTSVVTICGDLQGIAEGGLPGLDAAVGLDLLESDSDAAPSPD